MNELIQKSVNELTMSSREIATLCDKEHKHVKRDIDVMTEQLELDTPRFGHIYLDSMNRQQTEYLLDKETCLCLVTGYNAKLRMAIIKRWQELENAKQSKPMTQIELVAFIANQMVEQERKSLELDQRLQVVEHAQQRLNQDNDHFTIKGFCSLHGIDLSNGKMSALSRKVKKLSEVKEYTYHEISDPRFGKVKCYHIDILTELFQMQNLL